MDETAVLAGQALVEGRLTGPVTLTIEGGRIASIDPPRADGVLDAADATVVPGLIDVHTHGAAGVQFIDGRSADLERLGAFYAAHGVTGYLATVGGSREHILDGIAAVRAYLEGGQRGRGARCLGLHLEGPFLSPRAPGAFRPETLVPPDVELLTEILEASAGHLRLMTLAPEVPGASAVIDLLAQHGVVCSAGHTVATAAELTGAVDAGIRGVTHLFNAMGPFHHREPGAVGIALTDPRLTCELVADGVHVDPTAVRLAVAAKGVERLVLVSDSIAATGMREGDYEFEEQPMSVRAGEARLADGTLAGSTLTLDRAVANLARWAEVPLFEAARSATESPARLLGLEATRGRIAVGLDADLAAFGSDQRLLWTMVGGELHRAGVA